MKAETMSLIAPSDPRQDVDAFARLVFDYCEGYAAIRLLREKGTEDTKPVSLYPRADGALAEIIANRIEPAAADQRGLFVVPCTIRDPGNARATNILQTCVVPVDLDSGDISAKRYHLERHLGVASMVVRSGGVTDDGQDKLHLLWRLSEAQEGEHLKKVVELRNRLIHLVDADASFCRLTQPIRVPGSIHGKFGKQSRARILHETAREYELEELLECARAMESLTSLPSRSPFRLKKDRVPVADLKRRKVRAGAVDGVTRFEAMSSVIGHWIRLARRGEVTLEEAWRAVQDHNVACLEPCWPADKLEREFQALLKKDRLDHGDVWRQIEVSRVAEDPGEVSPPPFSEDALAEEFVAAQGPDWRYVSAWGSWFHWDGRLWAADETHRVLHEIRTVIRTAALGLKKTEARRMAGSKTIRAVERIASSDPRIATRPSEWDSHLHLLNTPACVLDLATGEVLDHDRARLQTQVTNASLGSDCRTWSRFLDDVTGGDSELQSYLARICGYCLTGDTSEQVFFFFHGAGANGKSVFLQTVSRVLGSYAATAPLDSFMVGRANSHPTDLAGLRGKRLVTIPETEPGRAWAESRIKTITGGDPIRARLLYRDFFEFVPTFKLIVAGNHRPQLTSIGEAMRRRLHLVPFDVTIPPSQRDKELPKRLEAERDGILAWMVAGYHDWKKVGLSPPKVVANASEAYFGDEDLIGQWLDEQCVVDPTLRAPARMLFESWSSWADANGLERGSQKTLGEALRNRGFTAGRTRKERVWHGLSLRRSQGGEQ